MLAVQGYYDGAAFHALEKTKVQQNQRVIITIMDDFVEAPKISQTERRHKIEQLCGSLSEYATSNAMEKEKSAWARAAVKKHGDI
mgnify:FL=1